MDNILAINAGSSSLKWQLIEMPTEKVIAKGNTERIGLDDAIFSFVTQDGQKQKQIIAITDHAIAIQMILSALLSQQIIPTLDSITGVGHRVVAGGEYFKESTVVGPKELEIIEELSEFAPLHNPIEAEVIKMMIADLPNVKQVAVFDTSFHTSMPPVNYLYSLPYNYYTDFKARKYGAHGTSHQYVAEKTAEILNRPLTELKLITCHLGNGSSITAVQNGKSIDTSMGFTPLAGVTMGTRSGDIDPSLLSFLMDKLAITDISVMIDILNSKSGLLGISEIASDMRDLEDAAATNPQAALAREIFANRVGKYIGSYIATMNGCDAIIFTAGIGENDVDIRQKIISAITWFGCDIDDELNNNNTSGVISTPNAKIKVLIVPTNEEIVIARDTVRLGT
jgi:acetate kinase